MGKSVKIFNFSILNSFTKFFFFAGIKLLTEVTLFVKLEVTLMTSLASRKVHVSIPMAVNTDKLDREKPKCEKAFPDKMVSFSLHVIFPVGERTLNLIQWCSRENKVSSRVRVIIKKEKH